MDYHATMIEEVASGIELAALKSVCNRNYTLDKKISLFLNSLLMLYSVSEEERKGTIEKVQINNAIYMYFLYNEGILC